ncbi:MAG: serine/threonine protein kinase [Chitinispirillaceae bacterium]|nr:serine/threonine protein kinase [Chitinispirillaceae bacterium]
MIPRFPKGFSHPVQLGAGGFGSVYRARQDALNRLVALKFIVEKNASARAALVREASMQAGLHLQGIPQVYDVREAAGRVCIIMQWIRGCSLRIMFEKKLPPGYKHAVASEIIRIIAALHEHGYAHRDIKPENILISPEGVFLIDLGLALCVYQDARQTVANVVKGTPDYIAPELWRGLGRDADLKRADVYSMGKVIRELSGDDPLPECIASCLEEKPEARPPSAIEVLQEWKPGPERSPVNWSDIAEPCASEILARQLFDSARELLDIRRSAEAYDLLVECLQTHPDSPEALDLMASFPVMKKRKPWRLGVAFAAAGAVVIILGFVAASDFMKKQRINETAVSPRQGNGRSLFMSPSDTRIDGLDFSLPLKDEWGALKTLSGNLVVVSHPETGGLFIDGKQSIDISGTLRLPARSAEHRLVWRTADGLVVWKETVTALPFEIKRLCIKER